MNQKVKNLIEQHINEVDAERFDAIVEEAIRAGVLNELLDAFYEADISIPPHVITKQICQVSLKDTASSAEDLARSKDRFRYLINKHQLVIAETLKRGVKW